MEALAPLFRLHRLVWCYPVISSTTLNGGDTLFAENIHFGVSILCFSPLALRERGWG